MISETDLEFLVSLGDTDDGSVARYEVAEMYGVSAGEIDDLVLGIIYGHDEN